MPPLVRTLAALLLATVAARPGAAQDSIPRRDQGAYTAADVALPADRIVDLLALLPGVASLNDGDLSVHGAGRNALGTYLNGVSITPGHRSGRSALLGGSWFGASGAGAAVGTNAFRTLVLRQAPGSAERGGARGGVIEVESRIGLPGRRPALSGSWATDAAGGTAHGLGFNRLLVNAEGGVGRLTAGIAGALEGQNTARLGLEQNASPVYLANGTDTTVTFTGVGGTTTVDVLRFRASDGLRIPASATSNYSLIGHFGLDLGGGHALQLTALTSQNQAREFDYQNLYNPRQLNASRDWSSVLIAGWSGPIRQGDGLSIRGEAAVSYQIDHTTDGPLTTASESGSRDPWGGFLIAPLHFRFDASSFPVNDELVRNFRLNTGRITPYDLSNTTQYQLVDQYRNNAYGLTGFSEAGGPVGRLTILRERRLVAAPVIEFRFGERHRLRTGAELTRYDINYYSVASLISQAFSDAYLESPTREALFADYQLAISDLGVGVSLRYDHFASGASRPYFTDAAGNRTWFPRISTMPGFDPARPTALFERDRGHGRLSPGVSVAWQAGPALKVTGSLADAAQVPDFQAIYQGENTDLSVTATSQPYGSDLRLEHAVAGSLGAAYRLGNGWSVDGTIWSRRDYDVAAQRLVQLFDPQKRQDVPILRYVNTDPRKALGLDVRVDRLLGARGRAWVGYSYSNAKQELPGGALPITGTSDLPASDNRRHTVVAALLYRTGRPASPFGALGRDVGIFVTYRLASGTPYTRCPAAVPEDAGVLSDGGVCSRNIDGSINGSTLPALHLLDVRLSKAIQIGGATVTAFADARNLLNSRNVLRVFTQTGTTSNGLERSVGRITDLQGFALEASRNGALQADSTIDLSFGGQAAGGCGAWVTPAGNGATPNCVYLVRAEERFGDGDHLFTRAEQLRASDALYAVGRGLQQFTGSGRRVRIGLEIGF